MCKNHIRTFNKQLMHKIFQILNEEKRKHLTKSKFTATYFKYLIFFLITEPKLTFAFFAVLLFIILVELMMSFFLFSVIRMYL